METTSVAGGGETTTTRDGTERQAMMREHLPLVHHVARKLRRSFGPDVELDDLVSAGTLGLVSAVDNFDPSRGLRFSTFAMPRIRGAILDDLRRRDHVPRSVRKRQRRVARAEEELQARLSRAPSAQEVADEIGVDLDELWRWEWDAARSSRKSLHTSVGEEGEEGVELQELLAGSDGKEVEDAVNRREEVALLRDAILELKEQERIVLSLYYFEELKLREIGEVLGVTESRISQIRSKAIANLRAELRELTEDDQ